MVKHVVDLSGQQPRWPVAAHQLWTRCAIESGGDAGLWRHPASGGDERLRAALGARYRLDPANVTIVAGVRAAALAYADLHDRILLHTPSFLGLRPQLEQHAKVELTPDPGHQASPGDLIVVTSPARNPDGATLSPDDRLALEVAINAGVHVLANETYREWEPNALRVSGAAAMASLHKVAGVGARLGYVHSETFLESSIHHLAAAEPPMMWQRTWALFLERDGLDILVAENVATSTAAARAYDDSIVGFSGVERSKSGPHRILRLPDGVGEEDAVRRLSDRGYRAVGGRHFAVSVPSLRFCFIGVEPDDAIGLQALLAKLGLLAWEPAE